MDNQKRIINDRILLKEGFTLIEISIVILIIGLMVGGIMVGRHLVRSAELNNLIQDMNEYTTAINLFKQTYREIPGDMRKATVFWSSAGGTGKDGVCYLAQTQDSLATCDGNGDGNVHTTMGINYMERFMVWKHLSNAKLINGKYMGKTNGTVSSYNVVIGQNVPSVKSDPDIYFDIFTALAQNGNHFDKSNFVATSLQLYGPLSRNYGAISPSDAYVVDNKLDDGSPVYGIIYSTIKSSVVGTNCTTSDDSATAGYDFTIDDRNCALFFNLQ